MAHEDNLAGLDTAEVGYAFGEFFDVLLERRSSPAEIGGGKDWLGQTPSWWEGGCDVIGVGDGKEAVKESTDED
jgi:hypothetical protein